MQESLTGLRGINYQFLILELVRIHAQLQGVNIAYEEQLCQFDVKAWDW